MWGQLPPQTKLYGAAAPIALMILTPLEMTYSLVLQCMLNTMVKNVRLHTENKFFVNL